MAFSLYKIQNKFSFIFSVLLVLATGSIGWFSFNKTEEAVISSAIGDMHNDIEHIFGKNQVFHEQAKSAMVFALENRIFKDYFSLPETLKGHLLNAEGKLALSWRQRYLREQLNQWTFSLQKRFPIVETCIIDRSGQEHTRITRGKVAANEDLSASEASTPFFKPSFDLPAGEVYVSRPYMSTDVAEWVFAYTSPVVLDDGTIPAFYHFEIPLSLFQKFITDASTPRRNNTSTEKVDPLSDRMFIQTIDGLVIVDSAKATDFLQKPEFIREGKPNLEDYLSHVRTISNDPGFLALMEQARAGNEGYGHFDTDSKRYFVSYKSLPQFDWSLVRVQSYENLLKGDSSLAGIRNMILFTVFLVLIVGTVAVRIVSGHITQPLKLLSAAMHDLEENRFRDDLPIESNDELGKIVALFNEMSREIRRNQSFLLQERNKLTTIIHTTREGIIVSDQDDAVVLVNPSAERLLDKTAEQIRSEGFFNLVDEPDYIKSYINPDNKNLPEVVVYKGRVLNFYASSFLDQNGGKIGSIALMRDVTQEKQLESELRKISVTDKLTGLFNRRWLEEFMVKEFSRASRYHLELSVLFFDVDHFKKFNDTYGHDMGDLVLESIGEAARSNLRQSDYSCRYGGEEFCLVLTNTGSSGAMLVAENFRRKIEDMEVRSMKVTISIGVASYPQAKVNNPMELVKLADKALYAVKRSGRNRVMHWSDLEAAATSWD